MKTFNAKVNVTLKKSVLDPQGQTVLEALHSLGYKGTENLRVGKYFEVTLNAQDENSAKTQLKEMCEKLLVNTVIEQYEVHLS
ncbi:MAG: phosphoribosylformylglycinamidine synthase subunit PurS [Candidatus Omnitrophica bacterium]|nr:phosphoribosylformylglycinamidine synthase subunit PurS [Candidatus Omnitrophota bacterium]